MTHQQQTAFENIVGKEEIVRTNNFSFSHNVFLLSQIIVSPFVHAFELISLFAAEFEEPKIGISGKGLEATQLIGIPDEACLFENKPGQQEYI